MARKSAIRVRIPSDPKKNLKILFFFQIFFYYFQNISYTQIATFLSKCLIVGKKVRFQPIVEGIRKFEACIYRDEMNDELNFYI